ncbi:LysR family transcriptional regulator [Ensifer adhaerens]|uniref:LysR family transcriptional regulator n=1 Tax=Ensifer adhaerens TaxID=106592 RepID=UPI001CBE2B1C|nr:LysR family transcriptional regulator [Ensifer adhaerens]MBZ7927757.1 LysR family transcriptional regulator [Ensifer adhaerens]UAX96604.1 LysR family transcriptional regulator [Ensifer adhaerens]UAY04052.1 LysR family transcriptional regulator [Ensifer adhaerens]UAY12038.1 LysR family transcriptional regulator [Ensifer adhaerens]
MSDPLSRLSWDDLRVVKAIGEHGSLATAAASLGVNNSTMFRRLAQVEDALKVSLFDRRRTGYVATDAGTEVITLAQNIELEIIGVTTRFSGSDAGYAGDLRITTSDSLAYNLIVPIVADFRRENPGIRCEILIANSPLNLARGESDVAVRATSSPPENLFGRKVANIAWAVYAQRYAGFESRTLENLVHEQWASFTGSLSRLKSSKRIEEIVPHENITYRSDSVLCVAAAIEAGIGIGYLPCMLGDVNRNLSRIGSVEPSLTDELWVLTHPDIRRSGRVYAFMTYCNEAISKRRSLIGGTAPNFTR